MKKFAMLLALMMALGCGTMLTEPSLAKKPTKVMRSQAVATLSSVGGVLHLTDEMFASHPDDAVLFVNTFGTKGYGEPCFRVEMTDGSILNPGPPPTTYTLICALLSVYNPNPSNAVRISATFEYKADITYEPDYFTYQPLPRYVVTLIPQ